MSHPPGEIVVTYGRAGDAVRDLKRLRRFGLRSPRDHVIVEAARAVLVMVPVVLVLVETIRLDQAVAAYFGYFGLRWFNLFIKPDLLRRFGPKTPLGAAETALTMSFGPAGIRSETQNAIMQLKWRAVPPPEVFDDGVVLRIGAEESLVVAADRLPDGMSTRAFAAQVAAWQAGTAP